MSNPTSLMPLIRAGRVRPLAVTSAQRWPGMKELPTIAELGYPGFEAVACNGFVAPAGAPREVIERLNREINAHAGRRSSSAPQRASTEARPPRRGTVLPTRHVLPDTPRTGLVLNLPEFRLYDSARVGRANRGKYQRIR